MFCRGHASTLTETVMPAGESRAPLDARARAASLQNFQPIDEPGVDARNDYSSIQREFVSSTLKFRTVISKRILLFRSIK
jgi:hypothetical protein